MNDLIENINKLHTTEMGVQRIKRNLSLAVETNSYTIITAHTR